MKVILSDRQIEYIKRAIVSFSKRPIDLKQAQTEEIIVDEIINRLSTTKPETKAGQFRFK
jgi:hypothetical protein